jgi:hypothetical protein
MVGINSTARPLLSLLVLRNGTVKNSGLLLLTEVLRGPIHLWAKGQDLRRWLGPMVLRRWKECHSEMMTSFSHESNGGSSHGKVEAVRSGCQV